MSEEQKKILEELEKLNAEKDRGKELARRKKKELVQGCLIPLGGIVFLIGLLVVFFMAVGSSSEEDDCDDYLRNRAELNAMNIYLLGCERRARGL